MEKRYYVRASMESTPVNEKYLSVNLPVKVRLASVNKTEDGELHQIFSVQDTITTLIYSFSKRMLAEIKGDNLINIEFSRNLWENALGAKFEEIKNGD